MIPRRFERFDRALDRLEREEREDSRPVTEINEERERIYAAAGRSALSSADASVERAIATGEGLPVSPGEAIEEMAAKLRQLADRVDLEDAMNDARFTLCSFLKRKDDVLAVLCDAADAYRSLAGVAGPGVDLSCTVDEEFGLHTLFLVLPTLARRSGVDPIDVAALEALVARIQHTIWAGWGVTPEEVAAAARPPKEMLP